MGKIDMKKCFCCGVTYKLDPIFNQCPACGVEYTYNEWLVKAIERLSKI